MQIDLLIFFWDPLEPQPHDTDVKALLRLAAVWNIPVACNLASADMMISSPLFGADYVRHQPEHDRGAWETLDLASGRADTAPDAAAHAGHRTGILRSRDLDTASDEIHSVSE